MHVGLTIVPMQRCFFRKAACLHLVLPFLADSELNNTKSKVVTDWKLKVWCEKAAGLPVSLFLPWPSFPSVPFLLSCLSYDTWDLASVSEASTCNDALFPSCPYFEWKGLTEILLRKIWREKVVESSRGEDEIGERNAGEFFAEKVSSFVPFFADLVGFLVWLHVFLPYSFPSIANLFPPPRPLEFLLSPFFYWMSSIREVVSRRWCCYSFPVSSDMKHQWHHT